MDIRLRSRLVDPITEELPTELDLAKTRVLNTLMQDMNLYESEEGHERRKRALHELYALLKDWVIHSALDQGSAEHELRDMDIGLRLHTFGSYKLGVVAPDGDIDICIVNANSYVSRDTFFASFTDLLRKDPRTEKLVKVPEAYTPIIKFKFLGIEMDLLFAELSPNVKHLLLNDDIGNNEVLAGADDATVRCLNGIRVNQKILDLVPNQMVFRAALRLIKQWATARGLYSNVLGYFGGITYAILVAYICQYYPNSVASQIVCKFFKVYIQWDWRVPVQLCILEYYKTPPLSLLHVWSSKDPASRAHLMPILTPAFPSMNSTHNVSKTTKTILINEIKRGWEICKTIEEEKSENILNHWNTLIRPCDIFADYSNFIFVEIYAHSEDCFKDFCGYVDSKLRLLVKRLELTPGVELRPWPEGINFTPTEKLYKPFPPDEISTGYHYGQARVIAFHWDDNSAYYKTTGGVGTGDLERYVDFREAVEQWHEVVRSWTPNKSSYKDEVNTRIAYTSTADLPSYCEHSIAVQGHRERLRDQV